MNWTDIASISVTILLIMDPLGNVPVFNALLSKLDPPRRLIVVARELLIALVILFTFLLAGNAIMAFLGLTQSSLSIAGGVLLFIISLHMIFPSSSVIDLDGDDDEPFIVPLAMPLVAGPSTIALLLLLSSGQPERILEWCLALFLAWLGTTLILLTSPFLLNVIGEHGARALERLVGMILVILATQMLLDGIKEFVHSL